MSMSSCDAGRSSPGGPRCITPPVNRSRSAPKGRTTTNQEPHMARKPFAVNDAVRERVRYLAGVGVRQDDIAKMVGCSPKTLRKRLRDELDRGVAEANATIAGYLFAAAKAGNIAAIIFWLKTRANWRERAAPDDPILETRTESHRSNVVLLLPDNSRDPELTEVLQNAQEKYFVRQQRRQQLASPADTLPRKTKITGRKGGPGATEHTVDILSDNGGDLAPNDRGQPASARGA